MTFSFTIYIQLTENSLKLQHHYSFIRRSTCRKFATKQKQKQVTFTMTTNFMSHPNFLANTIDQLVES